MKLNSIIYSQAVRYLKGVIPGGGIYMPDLVNELRTRYGFLKFPTTLQEFDSSKGVNFEHGKFILPKSNPSDPDKEVLITNLTIYNNGIIAGTGAPTDRADLFIDDLLKGGVERFKLQINSDIRRMYLSQLEIILDADINSFISMQKNISSNLNTCINSYSNQDTSFEVFGLTLGHDSTKQLLLPPGPFKLERREGSPFSSNVYFSSAPLTTPDHLALLDDIEGFAAKKFPKKSETDSPQNPGRMIIL